MPVRWEEITKLPCTGFAGGFTDSLTTSKWVHSGYLR